MGLGEIKKKIIRDAESKKAELMKQAEIKVSEIISDYQKKANEYREGLLERAEADGQGEKRGIIIDAHLSVKNRLLQVKRDGIEAVFEEAKQRFKESGDYVDFLTREVEKYSNGDEEVIIGADEKKLDQKWLDSINKKIGGKLKFSSEKGQFQGGVILKSGNVFLNMTLETLLDEKRESLEKRVSDLLFS